MAPKRRRAARRTSTTASATRPGGPAAARPWLPLAVCAALAAVVLVIYLPTARFGFVNWDDATYVTDNPQVLRGLSWGNAAWALTTGHPPYWHPITWLSHMADVTFFGVDPGAFHVVNALLHALNAILVFLWWRAATGETTQSAVVAVFFAVLPVQVEPVAWIAERKELLSAALLLVSLFSYLAYTRTSTIGRYALVCATYALALMAKPSVVTYPLLLLLLDYWPLRRAPISTWSRLVLEKLPLAVLAVAVALLTLHLQAAAGALPTLARLTWSERIADALIAYPRYLGLVLWPRHLAAYYPLGLVTPVNALLGGLFVGAVTFACWSQRRSLPFLFVGWTWFLTGLAPVLGLIQSGGQAVADRFVYVPVIGLLVAATWGAAWLCGRLAIPRGAAVAVGGVVAVVGLAVARSQVRNWADGRALWTRVVAVTAPSQRAFENLGQADRDAGDLTGAADAYEHAIATPPGPGDDASAANLHNSLGVVFAREHQAGSAAREFGAAAHLNPTFEEATTNWGTALLNLARFRDAEQAFRTGIALNPNDSLAHLGLATSYMEDGRPDEATGEFTRAATLDASSAPAHEGLATSLAAQGDVPDAIREYRTAIRLDPTKPRGYLGLGLALLKSGDKAGATEALEKALQLDPSLTDARTALALSTGRF